MAQNEALQARAIREKSHVVTDSRRTKTGGGRRSMELLTTCSMKLEAEFFVEPARRPLVVRGSETEKGSNAPLELCTYPGRSV
jgi:hypothetical protein